MMARLSKCGLLIGLAGIAVATAGCGDSGAECGAGTMEVDGVCLPNPVPDAAEAPDAPGTPDAAQPDAAGPQSTRSGFIALADVTLLDSALAVGLPDFRGGTVLISYDTEPAALPPVYDDRDALGQGCAVWAYNLNNGEMPPVETDEGKVTITGAGLKKPLGECTYSDTVKDYVCIVRANVLSAGAVYHPNGDGGGGISYTNTVTVPGETFTVDDLGQYLQVSGFTQAKFNGAGPIVKVSAIDGSLAANQVIIAKASLLGPGAEETLAADGSYAVLGGVGPTPVAQAALDDGTGAINIVKEASTEVEAIDETMNAGGYDTTAGASWHLADGSDVPSTYDLTGTDPVTFTCDEADNGLCGSATVMAVFGETTTGAPNPFDPYGMPESTEGIVVNFLCAQLGADAVTLPTAVMAWVRGTAPTKVQTTVLRGNLQQVGNADQTNGTNIMVGYGYAGINTP